jgi:hypothetical protein
MICEILSVSSSTDSLKLTKNGEILQCNRIVIRYRSPIGQLQHRLRQVVQLNFKTRKPLSGGKARNFMSTSNNYLIDNFSPVTSMMNWERNPFSAWQMISNEFRCDGSAIAYASAAKFSAKDLVFECDIKVSPNYDAGVTIRSTDGEDGYFISVRPAENTIKVFDLPKNSLVLAEGNVTIAANEWKHLRVIMIKDRLLVYYDNMMLPIINFITNTYYLNDGLFLRSYFNQVAYRQVKVYEIKDFFMETLDKKLLTKWIPYKGGVSIVDDMISSPGSSINILTANTKDLNNFSIEADIKIDGNGDCGFMLRSFNVASEDGYYVGFNANEQRCYIYELNGGNGVTNREALNINITQSVFFHAQVICNGNNIFVYLNDDETPIISATSTSFKTGKAGIRSYYVNSYFDNIRIYTINTIIPF